MKKLALAALIALGVVGAGHAAGNAAAGMDKAATCAGCHGPDGNSMIPMWPKLAGQHANYIAKQLGDFKSGARVDATMTAMVAPLGAQDIQDIAAWFASQKLNPGSAADAAKAEQGKKIYNGGVPTKGISACMACHGPSGAGNPGALFPSLKGQHTTYVVKALKDFRSATRSNDAAKMMQNIAAKMSDAEIDAVAEYISGLQ